MDIYRYTDYIVYTHAKLGVVISVDGSVLWGWGRSDVDACFFLDRGGVILGIGRGYKMVYDPNFNGGIGAHYK